MPPLPNLRLVANRWLCVKQRDARHAPHARTTVPDLTPAPPRLDHNLTVARAQALLEELSVLRTAHSPPPVFPSLKPEPAALWQSLLWLSGLAALLAALAGVSLVLLRRHLDSGGYLPLPDRRYYARRYASPAGEAGARVQQWMRAVCTAAVGELLPHPALHSLDALAKDKLVLVLFDRRTNEPVMFHMAFKAGYLQAVVIHLGLVMVVPSHQGRHLQRLSVLNVVASCLTYWAAAFVLTDIAASPSATAQVGDNCRSCFPNYRQYNAAGPQPWQLDVARFLMAYHRQDFGTSASAVLDEGTLVVRGSNAPGPGGQGGASALVAHHGTRRSRSARPNAFVASLLAGSTHDELLHVGRASLGGFLAAALLRASPGLRAAAMAGHLLTLVPAFVPAALGRPDACLARFRSFAAAVGLVVTVVGAPAPRPGGVLWVANHFSWLDYPVLQCASPRLLRVVARADMAAEGVFGALAQRVLRSVGVIEYRRGDKGSGAAVRGALRAALVGPAAEPVLLFPEGTSQVDGPPRAFRTGGLAVAFDQGVPCQPVALWYSEPVGLAPETDALAGTARLLCRETQAVVAFGPLLAPGDYGSADDFAAACESAVRDAYAGIAAGAGFGGAGGGGEAAAEAAGAAGGGGGGGLGARAGAGGEEEGAGAAAAAGAEGPPSPARSRKESKKGE